jgi:hypothetical protein
MDTMAITVLADGTLQVNTGRITRGGADNPLREVPYTA